MWYDVEENITQYINQGIKFIHKNHICSEYEECAKKKYNRNIAQLSEIKYVYSGKFNWDDVNAKYILDSLNEKNMIDEDIIQIITNIDKSNLKPSEIKFITPCDIVFINIRGFNKDHRGQDHTLIKLPFLQEINLKNEFTLENLIDCNYHLKSHKFDYWYELYCGTHCESDTNYINVFLNFDHGSQKIFLFNGC